MRRRTFISAALATTGAVLLPAARASSAFAASVIPQSGADPVVINQAATTDNVTVLMATAAQYLSDMQVVGGDSRKNFYVDNFLTSSDYLAWTVSAAAGDTYQVTALVNTSAGEQLTVAIQGTSSSSTFTAPAGWNRVSAGTLTLPTGTSTIVFSRDTLEIGRAHV